MIDVICRDSSTIRCELTASLRLRVPNDDDAETSSLESGLLSSMGEKEIILCFRPVVKEEICPSKISDSSGSKRDDDDPC